MTVADITEIAAPRGANLVRANGNRHRLATDDAVSGPPTGPLNPAAMRHR